MKKVPFSADKLSFDQCQHIIGLCQDQKDSIDAEWLQRISVNHQEYHTMETRGNVAAVKEISKRTGCPFRIAILAVKKANGSFSR